MRVNEMASCRVARAQPDLRWPRLELSPCSGDDLCAEAQATGPRSWEKFWAFTRHSSTATPPLARRSFSTSRKMTAPLWEASLASKRRVNLLRHSRLSSKHNKSSCSASSARYLRQNDSQPLDVWRRQRRRCNAMLGPASRSHRSAPTRCLVIPAGHCRSTRMRKPSSSDMLSRARFTSRVPAASFSRGSLDTRVGYEREISECTAARFDQTLSCDGRPPSRRARMHPPRSRCRQDPTLG